MPERRPRKGVIGKLLLRWVGRVPTALARIARFLACWTVRWAAGWVGDADDVDAPRAVLDEDQHVQTLKQDGVEVEEVDCEDAVGLDGEEPAPHRAGPLRGGVDARGVQDLPDRGQGRRPLHVRHARSGRSGQYS
ncbi:hypothetical protein [Streptomyces sp. NPDC056721]|uniref:hypothetical protein n=1 Tax=unclassified Streptomyces TaxID=2593676 RepID=UPI0036AB3480